MDDIFKLLGAAAVGAAGGFMLGQQSAAAPSVAVSPAAGSWATMLLKPTGIRAGADTGNPLTSNTLFNKGNLNSVGLWECQPGGFPVKDRPTTETVRFVGTVCHNVPQITMLQNSTAVLEISCS